MLKITTLHIILLTLFSCGKGEVLNEPETVFSASIDKVNYESNGLNLYFSPSRKGSRIILCLSRIDLNFKKVEDENHFLTNKSDLIKPEEVKLFIAGGWVEANYRIDTRKGFGFVRTSIKDIDKIEIDYRDTDGSRKTAVIITETKK